MGLLVADECHMVPAPMIGDLLEQLLDSGRQRRLVGLTGTLLREGGGTDVVTDQTGTEVPWPLLGACVHRETFAELAPMYLAPVRCIEVRVPPAVKWRKLFAHRPLASAVCLSRGKFEVLEHLLARHAQDSLLITVERCEQARLIASTFGIIPLDGSVSSAQMKDYLDRFRRRKILALVATHVLDDSADFPELNVVIQMGGFFASRRQEQQRLGRLLRWSPTKRRHWDETGARPTFYVLVHEGTVEERMSQHRTSSVIGVHYEQISFGDLTSPPESLLEGSVLFHTAKPLGQSVSSTLSTCVNSAEASAKAMENRCFEMAKRTAANLPGGARRGSKAGDGAPVVEDRQALMSAIRSWLHGNRIEEGIAKACGDDSEHEFASDEDYGERALTPPDAQVRSSTGAPSMPSGVGEAQKKRRTCAASSSSSSTSSSSSSSSSGSSAEGKPQCERKTETSQSERKQVAPQSARKCAPKKERPRRTPAARQKSVRGAAAASASTRAASAADAPGPASGVAIDGAAEMQKTDAVPTLGASDSHGSVQDELEVPPGSDASNAVGCASTSNDASWGATTSGNATHGGSAVAVSQSPFARLQGQSHGVMIDLD